MPSLIVLGAGFSKPAGLPLGNDLFSRVIEEAKRRTLWKNIIEPDVNRYIYFLSTAKGISIDQEDIDFEDFLSYLDYEHFLGLKGSDTWSSEGNRSQIAIRNLISYVLHESQKNIEPDDFQMYLEFVDQLGIGDFIYTFNYDTLLECALESRNIPYRLFPDRFTHVHGAHAESEVEDHEVVVIKVHGSIDWFDISRIEEQEEYTKSLQLYSNPRHLVFSNPSDFMPEKIINGIYWPKSPLQKIYRISDMDRYFDEATLLLETPLIIAPSLSKTLYMQPLREFWDGFAKVGAWNSRVGVIGFSMPFHDDYILQPIYHLITNFQGVTDLPSGMEKSRLKMIDFRPTEKLIDEYKDRYKFVDWSMTDTYFSGLDYDSIEGFFS